MKLGKNPLACNRMRKELKNKAKRKSTYDSMRLLGMADATPYSHNSIKLMGSMIMRLPGSNEESQIEVSDIDVDTTVEVALKFPHNDVYRFHINVWRECCETFECSTMALTQSTSKDVNANFEKEIIILFNNKQDSEKAKAWWDSYRARFHNLDKEYLPKFANGQELSGCALAIENKHESRARSDWEDGSDRSTETEFFSEWVWLVQNTTGKIYWSRHHWFFADQGEMVQFKLSNDIPYLERTSF